MVKDALQTSTGTSEQRVGRIAMVVLLWLAIAGLLYGAWMFTGAKVLQQRQQLAQAAERYTQLMNAPGGFRKIAVDSTSPAEMVRASRVMELAQQEGIESLLPAGRTQADGWRMHLDGFSGYAVFRSEMYRDMLDAFGMQLQLTDDGGDSAARLLALRNGQADMAVFTLDALLREAAKNPSSGMGDPSDIVVVYVIDETVGADAMVALSEGLPTLQALGQPGSRLVLTANSPSETLARVVMASFGVGGGNAATGTTTGLALGTPKSWQFVNGSSEVLKQFRAAASNPVQRKNAAAYVLWEPELSQALQEPGAVVLFDSSRFRGFIVDVLVTTRRTLSQRNAHVRASTQAYARSLALAAAKPHGLRELVIADTKMTSAASGAAPLVLTSAQADRIVSGIWWKNVSESAAHLSVRSSMPANQSTQIPSLGEIAAGLISVLGQTGALSSEQLASSGRLWGIVPAGFVLDELRSRGFHPDGRGASGSAWPAVRGSAALPVLSNEQWQALSEVGSLQVSSVVFARGSATLTDQGRQAVRDAARMLAAFPQYYLTVKGVARSDGNAAANAKLAEQRSQAVMAELLSGGVAAARVRATASVEDGQAPAVSFVLGEVKK